MQRSREEILDWEARWRMPTALATLVGVVVLFASLGVISGVGGDGTADFLRDAHADGSSVMLAGVLQALGFLLLTVTLIYLFRATEARSERVRSQLIGLFIIAPLFLGIGSGLNALSTGEAADEFATGEAKPSLTRAEATEDCREERDDDGAQKFAEAHDGGAGPLADCTATELEEDAAEEAVSGASLRGISSGLQLAGILALAFSMLYGCLNAMRVGLLTRFWGSLGMALGVAAILSLIPFTWIWFLYFGLLVAGWIPNARPPAWAAGEAVPWPSPGERVAAEIESSDDAAHDPDELPPPADPGSSEGRRKRKQRAQGDESDQG